MQSNLIYLILRINGLYDASLLAVLVCYGWLHAVFAASHIIAQQ